MANQPINLGTAPLGEDGDTVRAAFEKVNSNTLELYSTKADSSSLGSAAFTDSSDYATAVQGALADTAIQNGDSRLTDAREWIAETVGQAEAEAGTATTRRAWTAQRVRQAIASWWLATSTAFGRSVATAADAAAGRGLLSVREQITADRTYFVRTDGSDSNNGLANTAGGAFLTIQKAVDTAAALDIGVFNITIRCTGTFTSGVTLKTLTGSGIVEIRGDSSDLTGFVVSPTSGDCFNFGNGFSGTYQLNFIALAAPAGAAIRGSGGGGTVNYGNIDFRPCSASHINISQGQICRITGPITISGGSAAHINCFDGGSVRENNQTITLIGNPGFTVFAACARAGTLVLTGNTYIGSATGIRYRPSQNGVIFVNGAGANYLPGDAAGVTETGGQYV